MPINCVAVAAGNINSLTMAQELAFYGYDGIVLGRHITEVEDIKMFIDFVHAVRGPPRSMGMGMKGTSWAT